MKAALGIVILSAFELSAQPAASPPTLTGIINLPGLKFAVLETKAGQRSTELSLEERQRDGPVEVSEIRPSEGRVNLKMKGSEALWLEMGDMTNSSSGNPPLVLKNAGLGSVLHLYSRCTGCSLLQHPALPRQMKFSLASQAGTLTEARRAIEAAFAEKLITTIPDGERFIIVAPQSEVPQIKPNAPKSASAAHPKNSSANELIPASMIDLRGADDVQTATLYSELLGKKLDRAAPLLSSGPPGTYFNTITPVSKEEATYAIGTLLSWRNIKLEPAGEGLVKAVRVTDER